MKFKNIRLLAVCTLALAGVSCNPDAIEEAVVHVKDVTVSPLTKSLYEGETFRLEAMVVPADAKDPAVEWSTNNEKVAVVDAQGLVMALAAGSASITATSRDGGYSARCRITVKSKDSPQPEPEPEPEPQPQPQPQTLRTWEDTGADVPRYPTYNATTDVKEFPRIDITWEQETQRLAEGEYTWVDGTVRFRDPKGMYEDDDEEA